MDEHPLTFKQFFMAKFDNIAFIFLVVFFIWVLVWSDKHNNSDFVKWMETFTAGFGGGYLSLVTGSRQSWANKQNGNTPPPAQKIAIVEKTQ